MSIKTEKVITAGFEMRYFKFGTGDKRMVVLPGLGVKSVMGSAKSIASAYSLMKDDYTVYVFDRRTVCPEGYTIQDMADDTAKVFDALGIKDAYLFGVSQGGMIAQCIAISRPELVCKLGLCSTVSKITEENSRIIENWIKVAKKGNEYDLNKSICEAVYSDEFCEKFGNIIMQLMSGATKEDINRFVILAEGCRSFDVCKKLNRITCPVFVAGTKKDKIFSADEFVFTAKQTKAQLYVYDDFGHAVYDEAPDFLERLKTFFDE